MWIDAPAKVNLTLDVLGKRTDGFHELETVMHKIGLMDRLYLQPGSGIRISSNDRTIAWDHTNLVYRAASLILSRFGTNLGVHIYVEKNIPIEAGLAGGSTDAAATLTGIDRLYHLDIGAVNLLTLAGELGSDVPFCLETGPTTALAQGRGERLQPLAFRSVLTLVVVKPPFRLSTAEVYGRLDLDRLQHRPDHLRFLQAVQAGSLEEMAAAMENVLETVSIAMYPEISLIKTRLEQAGAVKALMSGSGPSVFGLFAECCVAQQAVLQLKKSYSDVFLVSSY